MYKEENGNDFDTKTGSYEDYIFFKKEEQNYVKKKLALLTINQELANIVNRNKALLLAFNVKSLYLSANVDKDSYYPRIETGYQFTPNKELELIRQFNNRTFTQFKDQASASSKVRYHCPKNLIFQHLPIKENVILDGKIYKDVNRLRGG